MEIKQQLEELTTQFNQAWGEFREANDKRLAAIEERMEAPADFEEKVEKINTAMTEMRDQMNELEKRLNRPKIKPGEEDLAPEEIEARNAFVSYCRRGLTTMETEQRNALHSAGDADGGFLVPPSFESGIIMEAYQMAEMRPYAQVGTTGRDAVMLGALSKPLVAWGRQQLKVPTQQLKSGVRIIRIDDCKALALIHNNTLDDADADIVGELTDAFSLAIAEAEDFAFAAGPGDDSPQGIIVHPDVQANYVPTKVAADLSDASNNGVDALIDCFYKPKKVYRRNGVWGFNSTTEADIRKLKDDNKNYLWQPPVQAGEPALLLGKPVINPEGLPDVAANAFPIFFGDIRAGYKIRDRAGLVVRRAAERYLEYDQTGFFIKKRVGGLVTLAEAFSCVKVAAS